MSLRDLVSLSNRNVPTNHMRDRFGNLIDSVFSDMTLLPNSGWFNRFPALSVSEDDKKMLVKAELPAMDEKDIKVEVNEDRLTISGEKKDSLDEKKENYHICEMSYGKFSRNITLPFNIDESKVHAHCDKGVLSIEIDKPNKAVNKARNIPIGKKQ